MTTPFPDPALPLLVIIDDCDDDVFLLRHGLREGGITNPIVGFSSAAEARGYFDVMRMQGARPSLVFVEIKLPGDQGFELISWLRETPDWENVRIVVITSSNEPADMDRAVRLHVDGYLIKFPTPEMLAEFVHHGPWFAVPARPPAFVAAH
jgi:CheY-like chemotaxis protein